MAIKRFECKVVLIAYLNILLSCAGSIYFFDLMWPIKWLR